MKNQVLHVVVGAGNVRYFCNAIESILSNQAGDVFAIYNATCPEDARKIAAATEKLRMGVVKLVIQPNVLNGRTGSLYDANNLGLQYAVGKYRFVSFVQADMQLMWWDDAILDATEDFLAKTSHCDVSFYTQLPILGKHPDLYRRWSTQPGDIWPSVRGHVDVCLVPIFESFNKGFSFSGNEKRLSETRARANAQVFLHPIPFIAPIPFPETMRDYKARSVSSIAQTGPILKLNPKFNLDFRQNLHPISMETSILPSHGSIGFPYWPSDIQGTQWIRRRLGYLRLYGGSIFATIDNYGRKRRISFGGTQPTSLSVLRSLFVLAFEELKRLWLRAFSHRRG